MFSTRSFTLVSIVILFTASAFALDCGTRTCPDGNSCCNDVLMGPTCYDAGQASCASTGSLAADGSMTSRLCGANDAACGTVCYSPESYFCCAGQLTQNGQPCASAPTSSPTSAPTSSPTSAPTEAPTSAPTEAPTSAPTESPTSSPTSPANNCLAYGGSFGVYCSADEECCGAGTMTPSCIAAGSTKQCCQWFKSATQCEADEVCGGSDGPGASSYATCGAPGTKFCNFGTNTNIYCLQNQTCCNSLGYPDCCDTVPTSAPTDAPTSAPTEAPTDAPTSAPTDAPTSAPVILNNCRGASNTAGVNCSESETCCGAGTMSPSCIPNGSNKKCCVWYLSATQCDQDEVCGGDLGYGASSSARCGPAQTTFCNKGDGINAFCAQDTPTCCGNYGQLAFCCASNCTCPTNGGYSCVC